MAESGGDGFQIAKGFVSVEARVNEASVTAARQRVTGAPGAAGGAQTPPPAAQPAQPQPPAALGTRLADARASLADTGTQAARTLEQGFRQGLSSLSSMAVQQLKALSNVTGAARPAVPQVASGAGNAVALQQQSAQIVSAVSARLGPQIAQQVGNLLRAQAAVDRGRPVPPPTRPQAPVQQQQARSAAAPRSVGGQTVNNYTTNVRIEPKFVKQLLTVIKEINQLKSRNRATGGR